MIIGSLSTLAVNRQDIVGVISSVSEGQVASTATAKASSAITSDAGGATAGMSYVSPFGRYDYSSHMEILQFRNAETGKVTLQIPSERVVDAYRRGAAISAAPQTTHTAAAALQAGAAQFRQTAANQDNGNQTAAATPSTGRTPSTGAETSAAAAPAPAPEAAKPAPVVAPDTGITAAALPPPVPAPAPAAKPAAATGSAAVA